ncbi:hypothetical protein E4T38_07725 [Aureobasidium subglaciale]|nr:hypothetical protein E4T38_07725 [Aureobasidium subglaciale]KAI5216805.1 hypothetical protein E4T40_07735 [Aureobasidium subglaciale]KAI5220050.1 hypothetical protein E4T41_07650 [Aureobasidium subglaciale]KAI5257892.1 hypothetical protein E4T46_07626 [Aureobasidium subglaciale]
MKTAGVFAALAYAYFALAEDATVSLYNQAGCGGSENKMQLVPSVCTMANAQSIKATMDDIGIKFTCNTYAGSDYSPNGVFYVLCYPNPTL